MGLCHFKKICYKINILKKIFEQYMSEISTGLAGKLILKAPRKKCIRKCRLLKSSAANNCQPLLEN